MENVSSCIADHGIVVAVDFGRWRGPTVRGCAIKAATGYQLLHKAGFTTAGDQHDGPGFVCRIGDGAFHKGSQYPNAAQQSCVNTPSASSYWSYWVALPGKNTWTYSTLGAQADVPVSGEVQYWTYGGTDLGGSDGSGVPHIKPATLRTASATPHLVDAEPTSLKASSSSALPFVIGICLILALCTAAGWTTWRRRQYR
jgi:hypothetical protein